MNFLAPSPVTERRIAHELDGVAKTLLGVQQNGFAVEDSPSHSGAVKLRRCDAKSPTAQRAS